MYVYSYTCSNTYRYVCACLYINIHTYLAVNTMELKSLSERDYLIPDKELPARRSDILAFSTFELFLLEQV